MIYNLDEYQKHEDCTGIFTARSLCDHWDGYYQCTDCGEHGRSGDDPSLIKENIEIQKVAEAYEVKIFIAGSAVQAEQICEDFCTDVGLCVTVTDTTYTFRDGRENGVIVGLINYARFPKNPKDIWQTAVDLGYKLKHGLEQGSFTVQDDQRSIFISTRDEDQPK